MRATGDTTGSAWTEPAQAYASMLLEAEIAAAAVREALDVVEATGPDPSDPDTVLAIVRHSVARRVPRPAPEQSKRRLGRSTSSNACSRMPELLAARAASLLSPADVARLAGHLDGCEECSALESRMAEADRAFYAVYQQPEAAPQPGSSAPATWAGAGAVRPSGPVSAWLPSDVAGAESEDDITVTRRAHGESPAAVGASAWLVEPDGEDPDLPTAQSTSEWLALEAIPLRGEPARPAGPSRARGNRRLRVLVPIVALLAVGGAGLALAGVFDSDEPATSAAVTTAEPEAPGPSATEARERAREAAQRRARRAERRAAARRRSERRATARRRAAARRRSAAAPVARTPTPTPAPAPVNRTPTPTPRPTPRRPTPPRRPTNRTQTTPRTPSDTPKPSAPSSEPGRQAPTP